MKLKILFSNLMGVALGWVEANVSNGCRDVIGTGLRSLAGSNPVASTIFKEVS